MKNISNAKCFLCLKQKKAKKYIFFKGTRLWHTCEQRQCPRAREREKNSLNFMVSDR